MTQKFLGRVAGLALLLGASQADATIYDLDLTFGWNVNGQSGTGTITGTVQTDGNLGVLSSADTDTDAKPNAAAINATSSLFTNTFSPEMLRASKSSCRGSLNRQQSEPRTREFHKAQ